MQQPVTVELSVDSKQIYIQNLTIVIGATKPETTSKAVTVKRWTDVVDIVLRIIKLVITILLLYFS